MHDALTCTQVDKAFGPVPVLHGVNLTAQPGELVALLGPSGCGKTTLLRLIAGFEAPDGGSVAINGRVVAAPGTFVQPEDRRVGMVFQEYAIFQHMDVAANVAFGLRGSKREKQARADEMLALVGLSDCGARMPHELSGGQQQRVALARALAPRPEVLLLDEPFSNLDAALRTQVRAEVRAILAEAGTTAVFVTHDQQEALSLADRVAVMLGGRIAQVDRPPLLYQQPVSPEVAAFVGEANFLPGFADGAQVDCALGRLSLMAAAYGDVEVLLRPEALRLETARLDTDDESGGARVAWREYYGHDQRIGLTLPDGAMLVARAGPSQTVAVGQRVSVRVASPVMAYRAAAVMMQG